MEKPTKENTLYLVIKQVYFDQILAGTKSEEYREVKDTMVKKYLLMDEEGLPALNDKANVDDPLVNDGVPEAYNGGVFPYLPIQYQYLNLAVGYKADRQTMTVEVKDISFRVQEGKKGPILMYDDGENTPQMVTDPSKANACFWEIIYHLGKVIEHS